ncbi:MAG: IS630 family transposase [Actinobacteria bacterium]|nr:IS630 family transposase [Actinomycetota bacterium]
MPAPPTITLSTEEREQLHARVRAGTSEQRAVERARIVLLAAEGHANKEITRRLNVDADTVGKWRSRFAQQRLAGLEDQRRPGRPLVYNHDQRLKIIKTVTETPPEPASHWSGQQIADVLADEIGISRSQIWRILDDLDLKPHQVQSWLTSKDPEFWEKAADVCGLYLDPPDNALVLSVDEKSQMQAKSRKNPTKPVRSGTPERKEFEYRRHGTTCLFAALDVHTGEVIHETKERNRSKEFIEFLDEIDVVTPLDLSLHIVLDNGSSHVSRETKRWLACRPGRFVIHHTPTHASWLNQVELFFSILGRRLVRRGEFSSVEDLVAKVVAFIEHYNLSAKPFRWTYEGKPLRVA